MDEPIRIAPQQVRQQVLAGSTLFVCAYDSDEKFRKMHLEGAISLSEFKARLASLPKNQDIVFYCA